MDDISSKLKRLFKPKPKGFKGKGNVLGRAQEVRVARCASHARICRRRRIHILCSIVV